MDQLLNDKLDELEELQVSLEKAKLKIQGLEIENKRMAFDLDKAEQVLEEYYQKNQEQEELIENLGDQYRKEVSAREMRQVIAGEQSLKEKLKQQIEEIDSRSRSSNKMDRSRRMSNISQNISYSGQEMNKTN